MRVFKSDILSAVFLAILIACVLLKKVSPLILAVYFLMSIVSIIVYYLDKRAAQRNEWRIPEQTLHALAICGGWTGAVFAQNRFRHKTQKKSFRFVFWVTVLLNCALLIGLLNFS